MCRTPRRQARGATKKVNTIRRGNHRFVHDKVVSEITPIAAPDYIDGRFFVPLDLFNLNRLRECERAVRLAFGNNQ